MAEKKSSTKKSTKKKKNEGTDKLKYAVVVMAALIVLLVVYIILNHRNQNENNEEPKATPTTIVIATSTPVATQPVATNIPAATATPVATSTPVPTEAVSTPIVTNTPVPTEGAVKVSLEEAQKVVDKNIDTTLYEALIANDHLGINGITYYAFQVKDKNSGVKFDQLLIVNVDTGRLQIFADNEVSDFVKFPLDKAQAPDHGSSASITPEQAYNILCKYDKDSLGLSKNVSEYKYRTDGAITTINGAKQCYAIELYEISNGKERNRGTYYVSTDGLDVFYIDPETNKFVPVTLG